MGLTGAVWVSRIPAVKEQLQLSDGSLGVALFAAPIGLALGTVVSGRLVHRFGSARLTRIAGVAIGLLLVTPGVARNLPELMAALLACGVAGGTLDVAVNAHGVQVEQAYRRPIMSSLHASFSVGALAGALFGGAFAWAGIGPEPAFIAAGVPAAFAAAAAGRWLLARVPEPSPRKPDLPERDAPSGAVRDSRSVARLVVALGVLGVCGMLGEGAAGDWSGVYLRDNLGTSAGFAALGFAAFSITMTVGRFLGDRLAGRFGAVRLVRGCGLLAAAGLAGGLLSRSPLGGLAGFAVFGAGLSCVVPQVFSAAGRADPVRPARGLARVVGIGYLGLVGGPAVIGACASVVGLPVAFGIPVLLALGIVVLAGAVARAGTGTTARSEAVLARGDDPPEPPDGGG